MNADLIWQALGKKEELIHSVPPWVVDLIKQPYSSTMKLPVFAEPLQEDCVYRPNIEVNLLDKSYLEFLEEQIRLKPRGDTWDKILTARHTALITLAGKRLCHIHIRRIVDGLIQTCWILIDPETFTLVYWEAQ